MSCHQDTEVAQLCFIETSNIAEVKRFLRQADLGVIIIGLMSFSAYLLHLVVPCTYS